MGEEVISAAFRLTNYKISRFSFNLDNHDQATEDTSIFINPSGKFEKEKHLYTVFIEFKLLNKDQKTIVDAYLESYFQFKSPINFSDIPSYFYSNSIAIVFPYLRAFIATLSLQSNDHTIMLPTLNLTNLREELKNNTTEL